jgi:hypothetical protein
MVSAIVSAHWDADPLGVRDPTNNARLAALVPSANLCELSLRDRVTLGQDAVGRTNMTRSSGLQYASPDIPNQTSSRGLLEATSQRVHLIQ